MFVREQCEDDKWYVIVPLIWTLENVEIYFDKFSKFKMLSDSVPKNPESFESFVLSSAALWFEVIREEDNQPVGIVYVSDFDYDSVEHRFLSANYHVSLWDSKFGERHPLNRAFVRAIFARFRLHRLETEIPLFAGGAIRNAKKAGFVEEGRRRKVKKYNGEWFDVLRLSILETEVP